MASSKDNQYNPEELVTKLYYNIWTKHETDLIPEVFTEDAIYRDVGWELQEEGHDEILTYHKNCITIIPDFSMEVTRVLDVTNNIIAADWNYWGTFKFGKQRTPFGKLPGMSVITVRDNKIASCFDYYAAQDYLDALGMSEHTVDSFNEMMAAAAVRKAEKQAQGK